MTLDHVDLFSGIGGFALAARWAGINTVQFVEIDRFCHKVLNKNFPGVPIHDDIKTFTNAQYYGRIKTEIERKDFGTKSESQTGKDIRNKQSSGDVGVWGYEGRNGADVPKDRPFLLTGGFPCQPFSCAGKRKGTADSRHLWPEMLRVIKEFKPKWIIGENVAGIINIKSMEQQDGESGMESEAFNDGSDGQPSTVFIGILNDLEQAGYSVQPFIIPACAVNAPHRRDRVWIVAHSISNTEGSAYRGNFRECFGGRKESNKCKRDEMGCNITDKDSHAPDTESRQRLQGHENVTIGDQLLHGCRGEWSEPWLEVATRLCTLDDGLPAGLVRPKGWRVNSLKALGNAIVPQVAFEIMKAILAVEFNEQKTNKEV